MNTEEYLETIVLGAFLGLSLGFLGVALVYSYLSSRKTRKEEASRQQKAAADVCVAKLEASFGDRFDRLETRLGSRFDRLEVRIDGLESLFMERMGDLFRDHKTDMDRHFGKMSQSLVRLESGRLVEIDLKLDKLAYK